MTALPDIHGEDRRAWLQFVQESDPVHRPAHATPGTSNFEKTLAWRLALLVAVVVIGINVFAPDPEAAFAPGTTHTATPATTAAA